MPSDQSTWILSIPQDGDAEGAFQELHTKLTNAKSSAVLSPLAIPSFKVRIQHNQSTLRYTHLRFKDRNTGISH